MTKKYLVIATFLLLLIALSYGISQRIKPVPTQPKPPTPTQQNQQSSPSGKTPEPQITIPEGWKIYENKELEFEVGYPGDWFVQGEGKGGLEISSVRDFDLVLGKLGMEGADIRFGVRHNFSYSTLQEAKKSHSGLIIWDEYDTRAEYVKETTFLGFFAIERMGKPIPLSEPGYALEVNFIKDKTLFHFMLFAMTKEEVLRYEPVFRQMLETFSFI